VASGRAEIGQSRVAEIGEIGEIAELPSVIRQEFGFNFNSLRVARSLLFCR
jgi:hypothetical protein